MKEKCCFCGREISVGINGHNAKPIEVEGVEYPICCSECNCRIVVPTRIAVWPITDEAIYLKQEIERIKKNWEISKSQQRRLYDKLKANQNKDKVDFVVYKLAELGEHFRKQSKDSNGLMNSADLVMYINKQIEQLKGE